MVISHDRQLLNRAVTGILHLRDHGLAYYGGGYDQFDAERRMQLEQQHALARKQDAQRKHINLSLTGSGIKHLKLDRLGHG